jgi:hypothetical protein
LREVKDTENLGVFTVGIEQVLVTPEHIEAINSILVAKMYADLCHTVPFIFDYFGDPNADPYAADRFNIIETQCGWLVCDAHTNDHHEVLRRDLLRTEFDFIEFIAQQKDQLDANGELYNADHPRRVEAELKRLGLLGRDDIPQAFREFMLQLEQDPDTPGLAEEIIESLVEDFSSHVPYSFDPRVTDNVAAMTSSRRFKISWSEHGFLLLEDDFHQCGYELPHTKLLCGNWDPQIFWSKHTQI